MTSTVVPASRATALPNAAPRLAALVTLTGRRLALTVRNPRAILLPLATPVLIAVVIAPALARAAGPISGLDYMTYVAIGTAALVVPLSCMQAGLGVIVDRKSGARPDLLTAPIPRPLIVLANLAAALAASGLQLAALLAFSALRGAAFHLTAAGAGWFAAAAIGLAVATIGIAPWFFAGSLFPIGYLPGWLAAIAKLLPVTHAVALMRYGLAGSAAGLHAIWGLANVTQMAALSLLVLALYAFGLTWLAIRVFTRTALR